VTTSANRLVFGPSALRHLARAALLAGSALTFSSALAAEDAAADMADDGTTRAAREIVVQAEIGFRNRSEDGA
jgi:hypothetical protein